MSWDEAIAKGVLDPVTKKEVMDASDEVAGGALERAKTFVNHFKETGKSWDDYVAEGMKDPTTKLKVQQAAEEAREAAEKGLD